MESTSEGDTARPTVPYRLQWLFIAAIFSGSFLLFLVQPMVARMALPRLGGAPAVWNSAMLVYQALLLGGYAYAHWLGRVPARTQAAIHLCVLLFAALWLPIGLVAMELPAHAEPALWVPWLLVASIGPLFLAVSAQAPLLQRWFAVATHGRDPYALYAASNMGSFAGLLAYPLLVEPLMSLHAQSLLWTTGYVLVFLFILAAGLRLPRHGGDVPHVRHSSAAPSRGRALHWVVLAAVPSGLMLATSTFLTTDIVAVPLLWVVPLGLYLLSFTPAFATRRVFADVAIQVAPFVVLMFGATLISGDQSHPFLNAVIGLGLLFLVSVALHGQMYDLRPAPDRLTGFYLAMAVGGALGGVFAAVVAPVVFDWTYEYPLLILAAGMLLPQHYLFGFMRRLWSGDTRIVWIKRVAAMVIVVTCVWFGLRSPGAIWGGASVNIAFMLVALVGVLSVGQRIPYVVALAAALFLFGGYRALEFSLADARMRSYFGVYTVTQIQGERRLAHGTTLHGVQLAPPMERTPTTYYIPNSGVGEAMQSLDTLYGPHARVGVVGLGTGTLACYARPGQDWRFFEIDPAVVRLSREERRFTFLSECAPDARIVIGDARLRIGEMPDNSLDLLVLDAFSSDAVPMHLMTREAFATYARVLGPRGLLLVHISNRYLALSPVVSAAARAGGWHAERLVYFPNEEEQLREGTISDWIALSRDARSVETVVARGGEWEELKEYPGIAGWTDDYSSIVPLLRALHPELRND